MKSNYKRLGDYIRQVDVRNKGIITNNLLGINIDKFFMPSVANIIGTDLSNYKVIKNNQFACNPMHVGRDERIPVALYLENSEAIVSPAYFVFEIVKDELSSQYLMLWFRRPEFDRECWFYTDASVRGGITWEDFCEMRIPVPPIEEQEKIVDAYQKIETRIALKKKINENLEKQAAAMFHNLFDDQKTWKDGTIADLGEIVGGATPSKENAEYFCNNGIVWLTPKDLTSTGLKFIYKGETDITKTAYQSCSTKIMPQGTVLLTSRAPVGSVAIAMVDLCTNQGFKSIVPKEKIGTAYVYYFLKENKQLLASYSSGTTFMEISGNVLKSIPTKIPPCSLTEKFTQLCKPMFSYQAKLELEIMKLNQLLTVINSSLVAC